MRALVRVVEPDWPVSVAVHWLWARSARNGPSWRSCAGKRTSAELLTEPDAPVLPWSVTVCSADPPEGRVTDAVQAALSVVVLVQPGDPKGPRSSGGPPKIPRNVW